MLEGMVKKFFRNTILAGSLALGAAINSDAQNVVSGNVQSVPTNIAPTQTRVTFTNTSNSTKYSQLSLDGNFSISIPTGTYQRKIEGIGNYAVIDTLFINSTRTINEKVIDAEPLTSTVYGPTGFNWSLLQLLKVLTGKEEGSPNTILNHALNTNNWRLFARNYNALDPESMPSDLRDDLDYAITEFESKIPEINFNEVFTEDLNNGITFVYKTTANMPQPYTGWTVADVNKALIYIDRNKINDNFGEKKIFMRELFRATVIGTYSLDPNFITYYENALSETIHPDEANVMRRFLTLSQGTDMKKHRDILVSSLPNTLPTTPTIVSPINNSTIIYDAQNRVEINSDPDVLRDIDGDIINKTVEVYQGATLIKTTTVPNNTLVYVLKTELQPNTTYTTRVRATDGIGNTPYSSVITFTTPANPNTPPPTPTWVYPTNNQIVTYTSNQFEANIDPDTGVDIDGNNLTRTIELWNAAQTTLIKTYSGANNTQIQIPKTDLQPHTSYVLKAKITDGIETSTIVNTTFQTPNTLPPTPTWVYPTNNQTITYDAQNRFEANIDPDNAQDADLDNLNRTIELWNAAQTTLIKTYSGANNTQIFIPKTDVQPHTPYVLKAKITDGIATTIEQIVNFSTPNTLPTTPTIVAPINNTTITYDAQNRVEINTDPDLATDADLDNINKTVEILQGTTIIKTTTVPNNNLVYVLKSELTPNTTYTVRARATDGIATTPNSNIITFTTPANPNTPPPTPTWVYPLSNQVITYDAQNQFEANIDPDTGVDADGDNLIRTIELWNAAQTTLIKTYTQANNTQIQIPKADLQAHTPYVLKAKITDGKEISTTINTTFQTPNTIPTTPTIVAPINNTTITYDAQNRVEINTDPDNAQDADLDNINKTVEILQGTTIIKTTTVPNNTLVYALKTELQPHTIYTVRARATDGIATTPNSNTITFTTPNTLPPTPTWVYPTTGQIITYDAQNRFEANIDPDNAQDADLDNLNRTIELWNAAQTTLIKTYSGANNTQIFIPKTDVQPSTSYVLKAKLSDGIATSTIVNTTFTTPANPNTPPPTPTWVYPLSNQVITYTSNQFEANIDPDQAIDVDGDNLIRTIELWNAAQTTLIKTYSGANNTQIQIPKTDLQPHTSYVLKAKITDGKEISTIVNTTFQTPNTIPTTPTIVAPINNTTITYDAQNRVEINTDPDNAQDADLDNINKTVEILQGTTIIKTVTTANNNLVYVLKTELTPNTTYTVRARATDGIATTPNSNIITFTTPANPNTPPPTPTWVYPTNNQIITYTSNQFEANIDPDTGVDIEGNNLTRTIELWNAAQTTIIKTYTQANNTQVLIPKTDVQPHTSYVLKAKITDGIETSTTINTTFQTPNTLPPAQTIISPTNGQIITYDAQNRVEINNDPDLAVDGDGDSLDKRIRIYRASDNLLIKDVTVPNEQQFYLLKSELQAHTNYIARTTLTDGIATTTEQVVNFSTPNTLPPTPTWIYPTNNQIVTYDAQNRFEANIDPDNAQDADLDNLTRTIELWNAAQTTIIKTYTQANNTQIFIPKTDVQPHTAYVLKAKISDGIATTIEQVVNFSTPNTLPTTPSIVLPINNTTIVYNAQNQFEIDSNPDLATDADGDLVNKIVEIYLGTTLVNTTVSANNAQVFINKSQLSPNTTYTVKVKATDGFGTTPYSNIVTFTTPVDIIPNTPPPAQTIISPTNGQIITYDAQNRVELNTDPDQATDIDGDSLDKRIRIYRASDNLLIKDVTVPNEQQFYLLKSELQAHTDYIARTTLTDGKETTLEKSVNFKTPNTIPTTPIIISPINNTTITYDAQNRLELNADPDNTTDADGDVVNKIFDIYLGATLIKTITVANNLMAYVSKSDLLPHTTYTVRARATDGIETTVNSNIVTFSTPNTLPPTQTLIYPTNNTTIVYDAQNRVELNTDPDQATDADGDNLIKRYKLYEGTTLIKDVTAPNNQLIYLLKSELKPHTTYNLRTTLTDGIATTPELSINFSTPNTIPTTPTIISPTNNSTIAYDAQNRLEINTDPDNAQDADLDNLTKTIEILLGTNVVKTITIANNLPAYVLQSELLSNTTYTVRSKVTDEIATTPYSNIITFKTPINIVPNTPPPTPVWTYPTNNQIVTYNAQNQFEANIDPDQAVDGDGNNLTRTIELWNAAQTTIIKTYTQANNTQVLIPKADLQAHTSYVLKAKITDGIETSTIVNTTFQTPNTSPTTPSFIYPTNNQIVTYDAQNKFEANIDPDVATDIDGDPLNRTIELWNSAQTTLIKTYTQANNTQIFIPKTDLQSNTSYVLKAKVTDGILATPYVSTTFKTPIDNISNVPPPIQTIISPLNAEIISYGTQGKFEIDTAPDDATGIDGDPLTKRIKIYQGADLKLDTLVANNLPLYINKGRLKAHTDYSIKATLSDGKETTQELSRDFSTPNYLPVFGFVSPNNGQVISYNANKELDIITSPPELKDSDGDDLTKYLKITGPGLDTLITKPNNTRVYLKESRLQPNSVYTIEGALSDGINTTTSINTTFKTPIIVGVEPISKGTNSLEIFPNPSTDYINLQIKNHTPVKYNVEIYNIEGKLVDHDSQNYYGQEHEKQYDVSGLSNGMYIMKVTTQDNTGKSYTTTKKIIKN